MSRLSPLRVAEGPNKFQSQTVGGPIDPNGKFAEAAGKANVDAGWRAEGGPQTKKTLFWQARM